MLTNAYTLFDMKSGVHNPPFFFVNHASAIRAVQGLGADLSTMVGRHPGDFILFCIGSYDDQLGQLLPAPQVHLGIVAEMLVRQEAAPSLFPGDQLAGAAGQGVEHLAGPRFANGGKGDR